MPFRLEPFIDAGLTPDLLRLVIDEHRTRTLPRLTRLWTYYRNPCEGAGTRAGQAGRSRRCYRLGQEQGLPDRLVGPRDPSMDDRAPARREIVIENAPPHIAWRRSAAHQVRTGAAWRPPHASLFLLMRRARQAASDAPSPPLSPTKPAIES